MKILIFAINLLVFSKLGKAQGEDDNCDDPLADVCDMDDFDVLKITCAEVEEGTVTCTCADPPGVKGRDDACSGITVEQKEMSAEECRQLCITQSGAQAEAACYFWRWEQHANPNEKYQCTMRSRKTACAYANPCFEPAECVAGHIFDQDCNGGEPTEPPTPKPEPVGCPGKINYDPSLVHWHCIAPPPTPPTPKRSSEDTHLNPYKDDEIDSEAICFTMKKCAAWNESIAIGEVTSYYHELVARCDGFSQTDGKGTWVADTSRTGDVAITEKMVEGNTLIEPDLNNPEHCSTKCPDFELDEKVRNKPGIEVFCTYPLGEDWKIKDGNSCILLCDSQLQKDVSCSYIPEDGSKKWQNSINTQQPEQPEDINEAEFVCEWTL